MAVTRRIIGASLLFGIVSSQASSTLAPANITSSPSATTTSVTSVSHCHNHGTTQFCFAGSDEYQILATATSGGELPSSYSGCHYHDASLYCLTDGGDEVQLLPEGATAEEPNTHTVKQIPASSITAVTSCHGHGTTQYCMAGSVEYQVLAIATSTGEPPSQYTGCHPHSEDEVQLLAEGASAETAEETSSGDSSTCHFHAGVEHCVGGSGGEESGAASCEVRQRDYNIPLRIGLIFAILAGSSLGSFGPVFLTSLTRINPHHIIFTILNYESTSSAIVMAGIFISFLVEYWGRRMVRWRQSKRTPVISEAVAVADNASSKEISAPTSHGHHGFGNLKEPNRLSVVVLEAGLIFHSVLIGVTLVVSGDTFFLTLFAVIFFHQIFEGIALGTRIGEIPSSQASLPMKLLMSAGFALSTPVGMAIGIGVLSSFNGNDPSTIIAIGTLDAFSAGILVWVGVVEMWAEDWLHGDLANAGMVRTALAFFGLIVGALLMSVLGKWA
ncbi:Zip-domain-containing protein [Tothia fuscella]|uniref:Zip-domain-containing protein n=1 Tax=Tothia fuscella TaxID=1048955 RepID=A0A9P4P3U8_9PEZI|nr:Zip-domain-containing protein [Tothia fuscella]